ncbi:hypothetical protein N9J36_04555 [Litoricola sp.]|nr:hypothetical protein [Litorivicinus sp.]
MKEAFDPKELDEEILARARAGDPSDARHALKSAVIALNRFSFNSPYLLYLQECLEQIVSGVEPNRALGLEEDAKRGTPRKWNGIEVMAVDIYLRKYFSYSPEKALEQTVEIFGIADKRTVRDFRKEYDSGWAESAGPLMEQLSKDDLLDNMPESIRKNLPH